ncbi:hypothetical protein MAUB1S_02705 [Mycolicibacterium aubagnense]
MRFGDVFVSKEDRYSISVDLDSGRHYISIPVSNGLANYAEYYSISSRQAEAFLRPGNAAIEFVAECRQRQHDDVLIQEPGTNTGAQHPERLSDR